jgi:hypothetical protein
VDAQTINAIVDAIGAMVLCLSNRMTPEDKALFVQEMARLSANATASGNPLAGRLLNDISRAASR